MNYLGQRWRRRRPYRQEAPTRRRRRQEQRLETLLATWRSYCLYLNAWMSELPLPLSQAAFTGDFRELSEEERRHIEAMQEWYGYNFSRAARAIRELDPDIVLGIEGCTTYRGNGPDLLRPAPSIQPRIRTTPRRGPATVRLSQSKMMKTYPLGLPFGLGQQYDWPQAPIPGVIPEEWGLQPRVDDEPLPAPEGEPEPEVPQPVAVPPPAPTLMPGAFPQIRPSMVVSFQPITMPRFTPPTTYTSVTSYAPKAVSPEPEEPSEVTTVLEETWPLWLLLAAGVVAAVS